MIPWVCRQCMRVMQAVFGHKMLMWAMAVIVCQDDIKDRVVGASLNVQLSAGDGDDEDDPGPLWGEISRIARDRWGMIDDAESSK